MASGAPRLNVALARLVDLKAALLAETRVRAALTGRACARRNWHGARATSSVDGWASNNGAALARGRGGGCEVFRAPPSLGRLADSSKRASEPDAEPPPRARTVVVPLTRRLRRAVAVCRPEEPVSRLVRSPFFGDVTFFYTAPAPPRPAPPRSAPPRAGAATRGRRRAPCSLRLVAYAVSPAPRCLCAAPPVRRAASRRGAARGAASPPPPRRLRLAASASPPPPRRLRLAASASPPPPRRLRLAASASHRAASSVSPPRAAL
jgi:hypothetical protein